MTLEDTIETFSYFIKEVDVMNLAYVCLMRYAAKLDVEFDGEYCHVCSASVYPEPLHREKARHPA